MPRIGPTFSSPAHPAAVAASGAVQSAQNTAQSARGNRPPPPVRPSLLSGIKSRWRLGKVNKRDRHGRTPLHYAIIECDAEKVRKFLKQGANPNKADRESGKTPLHMAAERKEAAAIMQLLAAMPDIDPAVRDSQGELPIHGAVRTGNPESVRLLLPALRSKVEQLDRRQRILMHLAAKAGRSDVVRLLLDSGMLSDVNHVDTHGYTPLSIAARRGDTEMLGMLLPHCQFPYFNGNGNAGLSAARGAGRPFLAPLYLAARNGQADAVRMLLQEQRIAVNAVSPDGSSALHAAIENGHLPVVQALLAAPGIAVNNAWRLGDPRPLDLAIRHNRQDIAALLRRHGAETSPSPPQARHTAAAATRPAAAAGQAPAVDARSLGLTDAQLLEARRLQERFDQGGGSTPSIHHPPLAQTVAPWLSGDGASIDAKAREWHAIEERSVQSQGKALQFARFLERLRETSDFSNDRMRPVLQRRVAALLDFLVAAEPGLRETCFCLAEDGLTDCGDRVALVLNQIELEIIDHRARHGQMNDRALFATGRSMFRMAVIEEQARELLPLLQQRRHGVTFHSVEALLALHVRLKDEFQLPAAGGSMQNEISSRLTDAEYDQVRTAIRQREQHGAFEEFMASWQPWQRMLERKHPAEFKLLRDQIAAKQEALAIPPPNMSSGEYMRRCQQLSDECDRMFVSKCRAVGAETFRACGSV